MAGSISDFKANFVKDLARPNRFDVFVSVPPILDGQGSLSNIQSIGLLEGLKVMKYRCENAQLPGRTLATAEQKIYGPTEKYPYQTTYGDLELTFIVSEDMVEKYIFDHWLERINPSATNDFAYKYNYSSTITVNQYNLQNEITYSADFIEAYPISVNQMDLDWSADGYHKLTVTFAYTRWFNRTESKI